jgi:type III restriction enzyme
VQRKLKAASNWCERINGLDEAHRTERVWRYVLLGESVFYEWRDKNARMVELLEFARVRVGSAALAQGAWGW